MGAEGKYDLSLAPSHDPEKLRHYMAAKSEAVAMATKGKVVLGDPVKAKVFSAKQ